MRIRDILLEVPAMHDHLPKAKANRYYDGPPDGAVMGQQIWWVPAGKNNKGQDAAKIYGYPDPSSGKYAYDKASELNDAVKKFEAGGKDHSSQSESGGPIIWVNQQARDKDPELYRAFAVGRARNENGEKFWVGKYLTNTKRVEKFHYGAEGYQKLDMFDTNDLKDELNYQSNRARGEAGFAPEDLSSILSINDLSPKGLGLTDKELSVSEILTVILKKVDGDRSHPVYQAAVQASDGSAAIKMESGITPAQYSQVSKDPNSALLYQVQVNYPEVLHPLSVAGGHSYPGIPSTINPDSTIVYSKGPAPLWDSKIITPNNEEIIIGSKKKGSERQEGAAQVIGVDTLTEIDKLPDEVKQNSISAYNVIRAFATNPIKPEGGNLGPLEAALLLPTPMIDRRTATYFSSTFGNKDFMDKPYKSYPRSFLDSIATSYPKLKTIIDNSDCVSNTNLPLYYCVLKYIMEDVARYFNSGPGHAQLESLFNEMFRNSSVIVMKTTPTVKTTREKITVDLSFSVSNTDTSKNIPVHMLSNQSYRSAEAFTRMKIQLGSPSADSDSGSPTAKPRARPTPKTQKSIAPADQQSSTTPAAVPKTDQSGKPDPVVQQQTIQALTTPGTALNRALMAVDPKERDEAREEALFDIKAGRTPEEVLAGLEGWLAESQELDRIRQLVGY